MTTMQVSVLVADDDADDTLLLQLAVKRANLGLRLQTVSDGEKAVDYLLGRNGFENRDAHPFPIFVLLDLKMPKMNGFEVLGYVKKQPELRKLPIIIFSSSNDPGDIRRAYDTGANSYLCKPTTSDGLTDLIQALHGYWLKHNHFPV